MRSLSPPEPPVQNRPSSWLVCRFLMVQGWLVGEAQATGQVVGTAPDLPIRALGRGACTAVRTIDAGGKTQGGLIYRHPRPVQQALAALPTDLEFPLMGSSTPRAEGHTTPSSVVATLVHRSGLGKWRLFLHEKAPPSRSGALAPMLP